MFTRFAETDLGPALLRQIQVDFRWCNVDQAVGMIQREDGLPPPGNTPLQTLFGFLIGQQQLVQQAKPDRIITMCGNLLPQKIGPLGCGQRLGKHNGIRLRIGGGRGTGRIKRNKG